MKKNNKKVELHDYINDKDVQRAFEKEMHVRGRREYYKHVAGEVFTFVALVVTTAVFTVLYMAVFSD